MIDRKAFYDALRKTKLMGVKLEQSEVDSIEAILNEAEKAKWSKDWIAYGLATAFHETDHTMQPIKEKGGDAYLMRMYDITSPIAKRRKLARENGNLTPGDGIRYCGKGLPQLTWKNNYEKASKVVGIDLVANPDRMLELPIATKVMIAGMQDGWFTGVKLRTYERPQGYDFYNARRIINGLDDASLIAGYARTFRKCLGA